MDFLAIGQIVASVLLIVSILFQQRGSGGSALFGAGGGGGTYFQKRGIEKFLFWSTILLSIILFSLALINLLI